MNGLKILITALLLALFLTSHASADEKPTITIAGIDNYRPFSYSGITQAEGLYNDILRELFRRAGYSLEIKLMPFKRILTMTERGDVTGMAGTFFTPARGEFATFLKVVPLTKITINIFVPEGSSIRSSELSELKGKVIGHKRGFIMSPELDSAAARGFFDLRETETIEQLVKMLMAQRLDGICYSNDIFYYIEKFDKKNIIKMLLPPVTDARFSYIAFSKKALVLLPGTFVADIQKAFISMVEDGTLKMLNMKYNIANE